MLTTNDAALAERLRLFAAHGMSPRYYHQVVGINSRLDTLQAAVLNVKLTRPGRLDGAARKPTPHRYDQLFSAAGLDCAARHCRACDAALRARLEPVHRPRPRPAAATP